MWPFSKRSRTPEDEALQRAERALDESVSDLRPFAEIDRILSARRDWRAQEAAYRRMIARFGTDLEGDRRTTVAALWHALGEIYRSRLKDYRASLTAHEISLEVDPDSELASEKGKEIVRNLRALIDGNR